MRRSSAAYNNRLPGMLAAGLNYAELAEEFAVSKQAIRAARVRRELPAPKAETLRDRVQSMKPLDAVEYLLSALESLPVANNAKYHAIDDLGVSLSCLERRLMIVLHDAGGRFVTRGGVYSAIYFDRVAADDFPDDAIIPTMVSKIRSKLPEGVQIKTVHGQGYRLSVK